MMTEFNSAVLVSGSWYLLARCHTVRTYWDASMEQSHRWCYWFHLCFAMIRHVCLLWKRPSQSTCGVALKVKFGCGSECLLLCWLSLQIHSIKPAWQFRIDAIDLTEVWMTMSSWYINYFVQRNITNCHSCWKLCWEKNNPLLISSLFNKIT